MKQIDVFSVRDLRNKSGKLLRDAEAGQISLITKHGKPAILAVPFDEHLISQGVPGEFVIKLRWVAEKDPYSGFANGSYPT